MGWVTGLNCRQGDLPMPWKATCHMDERVEFIARVLAGEDEMTVLCREYGISRKTGYKWLGRYISEGAAGLAERSHAPLQHGQAHDLAVVQAVLGLRQRWPHWGPKKLRVKLAEHHPELPAPAVSTIGEWLRREGVVGRSRQRRRRPHYTQPLPAALSGGGTARRGECAADFRGGLQGTWFAGGDPFGQWTAVCLARRRRTLAVGGVVDQAGHPARADCRRQAAAEWAARAGASHAQARDGDAASRQFAGAATAV